MVNEAIHTSVLSARLIANVSEDLVIKLNLKPHQRSLGLITANNDDVAYTALDEATKSAEVEVVYAKSLYAGAANSTSKLSGEVIGIIAGKNPAEIRCGLNTVIDFIENGAHFVSANEDNSIIYYAHCVSRTGTYLSKVAGIKEGEAIAYLVAPPIEFIYSLDIALKSADVQVKKLFEPPTETNLGGALLTGSQSACKASCDAFADAVKQVAQNPISY